MKIVNSKQIEDPKNLLKLLSEHKRIFLCQKIGCKYMRNDNTVEIKIPDYLYDALENPIHKSYCDSQHVSVTTTLIKINNKLLRIKISGEEFLGNIDWTIELIEN